MFKSSNFINHLLTFLVATIALVIPGTEDAVKEVVAGLIGTYSGGNILYHVIRDAGTRLSIKQVFKSKNFWLNLLTFVAGILPIIPIDSLKGIVDAIFTGDLNMILIQVFGAIGVIFKLFKSKQNG